jgi:hypothetical protein
MPFQNLILKHMTPADRAQLFSLIAQIMALLRPYLHNLSPEENKQLGHINEQNKQLVNKVDDYRVSQPGLCSPDVDWVEFEADLQSRNTYEKVCIMLKSLLKSVTETRRLHDHDLYKNAMVDYHHSKYKDRTDKGTGHDTKVEQLKPFVSKVGKRSLPDDI